MTIFSCCKSNGLHLVLLEVVQGQIYIYIHLYIYSRFVLEGLTLQKTRLKLVILSNIFPHRYLQKESLFLSLKCKMFTFVFLQWFSLDKTSASTVYTRSGSFNRRYTPTAEDCRRYNESSRRE